jgi:hypothetical protein
MTVIPIALAARGEVVRWCRTGRVRGLHLPHSMKGIRGSVGIQLAASVLNPNSLTYVLLRETAWQLRCAGMCH